MVLAGYLRTRFGVGQIAENDDFLTLGWVCTTAVSQTRTEDGSIDSDCKSRHKLCTGLKSWVKGGHLAQDSCYTLNQFTLL